MRLSVCLRGGADRRKNSRPTCPNCGFVMAAGQARRAIPGDRVLMDRTAFWFRGPRRWEVVALRPPTEVHGLVVKRDGTARRMRGPPPWLRLHQ